MARSRSPRPESDPARSIDTDKAPVSVGASSATARDITSLQSAAMTFARSEWELCQLLDAGVLHAEGIGTSRVVDLGELEGFYKSPVNVGNESPPYVTSCLSA